MAIKVALISLGCAKNQVDSEQMLSLMKNAGMELVADADGADAAVVNTCGFLESAVNEALSEILSLSLLKKKKRLKKIIVTGCMSERYKDDVLKELPEIDAVLGTGSYQKIVDAVHSALGGEKAACFDDINVSPLEGGRVLLSPSYTAYLKIAEGCDNHCAYCVIPSLRGHFRSRFMEDIVSEAETLAGRGVKELILVAQDLTRYGLDLYKERMLPELLTRLCRVPGIEWIRLHYLYPDEVDDKLLHTIASNKKILHYFDIPIQHISDKLLTSMNRRGNRAFIESLFSKIRETVPDAVIRTSIIVGLPGETDREFSELCAFLQKEKLPRAGIFAYSPEDGSKAALMENQVDSETKARRLDILQDIQLSVMEEYCKLQLGRSLAVLCEGFDKERQLYFGRTYADSPDIDEKVYFTSDRPITVGEIRMITITGTADFDLIGDALKQDGEPVL